jgi:hypothetical protein
MKILGNHNAFKKVCRWIDPKKVLKWALMSKRFYHKFIPSIITRILIVIRRGLKITENSIKILSLINFEWWETIFIPEAGKQSNNKYLIYPKIVQISNIEVCLIGGITQHPNRIKYNYEKPRSCIIIDLSNGKLSKKS